MFSIAFLLSSLGFIHQTILSLGFTSILSNVFLQNIYYWSAIPLLVAIFFASIESFFSIKTTTLLLKIFLVFTVFSLSMMGLPVSFELIPILTYQIIAIVTITSLSYLYLRNRDKCTLFFLLAIFSFTIGGLMMSMEILYLPIFFYLIGFTFIGLVFDVSSDSENRSIKGIQSYFSLTKKIETLEETIIASEEDYKRIFNNVNDIIAYIDKYGKIIRVNNRIEEFFGIKPEDVVGKNFTNLGLVDFKELPKLFKLMKDIFRGNTPDFIELEVKHKNGYNAFIEVSIRIIKKNGKINGILCIARDVTRRKKLEEELHKRNADIERLLSSNEDFIKQLGHDLKNPLSPLVSLLPILAEKETDPESKKIFDLLILNTNHIKNLVNKSIQITHLNSSNSDFDFETVVLFHEINEAIKMNEFFIKDADIEIHNMVNEDIIINADKLELIELFDNLFSNAIKFSLDGGSITIDAKVCEDCVMVIVTDTGAGIEEEKLKKIFDEFYKVDKSRHDLNSCGLGLSICKRIVEKHGGFIWAESQGLGKGSTFYFTFPQGDKKIVNKDENFNGTFD